MRAPREHQAPGASRSSTRDAVTHKKSVAKSQAIVLNVTATSWMLRTLAHSSLDRFCIRITAASGLQRPRRSNEIESLSSNHLVKNTGFAAIWQNSFRNLIYNEGLQDLAAPLTLDLWFLYSSDMVAHPAAEALGDAAVFHCKSSRNT